MTERPEETQESGPRFEKTKGMALFFWAFCLIGICGMHRIYLNRTSSGFVWLFTLGCLGFGQITDLFRLDRMIAEENGTALKPGTPAPKLNGGEPLRLPAAQGPDVTGQIERLARLRDQGILTEEEFTAKKVDLLARI